jgi:PAS domain S-box-containing protein
MTSRRPALDAARAVLVDDLLDAVVCTDAEGRIVAWNDAAERIYLCASADAIGRPLGEVVVRVTAADGEVDTALAERGRYRGAATHRRCDGVTFPVLESIRALVVDGEPVGRVAWFRELQGVGESEARATRLLDHARAQARMAAALSSLDADARAVARLVAQETSRLLGDCVVVALLDGEKAHAEPAAVVSPDPEAESLVWSVLEAHPYVPGVGLVGQALATGRPVVRSDTSAGIMADAARPEYREPMSRRPVYGLIAYPLVARGEIIGVLAAIRDRPGVPVNAGETELVESLAAGAARAIDAARLFEAEAAARRRLEEAVRDLSAFAYSVSHDLRAPLRAVAGYAAILEEDFTSELGEEGGELVERLQAAAERMSGLIDDILTLSRVTRGAMQREAVDLGALADEIVAELRAASPERSVVFERDAELTCEGDPGLLRVLLANLLGNAFKYTRVRATAHIRFGRAPSEPETLCVEDDGIGFPPEAASDLFEPFKRLHGREYPGSGIGLSTCARVVDRHGGWIMAEGKPGIGARILFSLPTLRPARRPHARSGAPTRPEPSREETT